MLKQFRKQGSLTFAAGATITSQIPTTGTHYGLKLVFVGTTVTRAKVLAAIDNIIIRLNGDIVLDATPAALCALWNYRNQRTAALATATSVAPAGTWSLPIDFVPQNLPTDLERQVFAWGMLDIGNYTLEIKCKGTITDVTGCDVYCLVSPEARPLGQHIRLNKLPQAAAGVGATDQEIATLPREGDKGVSFVALHCEEGENDATTGELRTSDKISVATVRVGGYDIFDHVPAMTNTTYLAACGRIRQAGYYHIDFGASNEIMGNLPMFSRTKNGTVFVQDFRLILTWLADASRIGNNIYAERIFGQRI
jgi:hypothetical protein